MGEKIDTKKLSIICVAIILLVLAVCAGIMINNQQESTVNEPAQIVESNSDVEDSDEEVEEQDSYVTVGETTFVVPSGYEVRSNGYNDTLGAYVCVLDDGYPEDLVLITVYTGMGEVTVPDDAMPKTINGIEGYNKIVPINVGTHYISGNDFSFQGGDKLIHVCCCYEGPIEKVISNWEEL